MISSDVASAYLQEFTCDKVYNIAGPEVGPKWEVKVIIIVKALYELKTSGGMWNLKLADILRNIGFRPCQADFDLWLCPWVDQYKYIAVYTDDLFLFTKNSEGILELLREVFHYELRGVGTPEYYNGVYVGYDKEK